MKDNVSTMLLYHLNLLDLLPFQVNDASEAQEYGIDELPGLLYFENKIPSMYDGELKNEDDLLKWLIEQKMTDTIEEV